MRVELDSNIMVRLSKEVKEKVGSQAKQNGQSLSEYIRMLIIEDLSKVR